MQRNELVAVVAGGTVGGGTLAAFLACTLGQALAYRLLDRFGNLYIDLIPSLVILGTGTAVWRLESRTT